MSVKGKRTLEPPSPARRGVHHDSASAHEPESEIADLWSRHHGLQLLAFHQLMAGAGWLGSTCERQWVPAILELAQRRHGVLAQLVYEVVEVRVESVPSMLPYDSPGMTSVVDLLVSSLEIEDQISANLQDLVRSSDRLRQPQSSGKARRVALDQVQESAEVRRLLTRVSRTRGSRLPVSQKVPARTPDAGDVAGRPAPTSRTIGCLA